MQAEEFERLAAVEANHWFYAGKRRIVAWWLRQLGALRPGALVVDVGAGTGAFAAELQARARVLAVDEHPSALAYLRQRLGAESVREGSCLALPLDSSAVDVVTALDVIEHVDDDARAAAELSRVLTAGGLLIVTVPAFDALWSDWDVSLGHKRRYTARSLRTLVEGAGLEVLHWNYVNVAAFLPVYFIRKARALFARGGGGTPRRAEDRVPPPWLNRLLEWLFVAPACQRRLRFPFGVGLLLVARRPTA